MRKSKFLSCVLCMALLVSSLAFPLSASAALVPGGHKATVELVAMKSDGADGYTEMTNADQLSANDLLYVGVKLVDFDQVENMSGDAGATNTHLTNIGFGLTFDNRYLTAEPDAVADEYDGDTLKGLVSPRMEQGILPTSGTGRYGGSALGVRNPDTNLSDSTKSTYKFDIGVAIQSQQGAYDGTEDGFVAFMEFQVKSVPENGVTDLFSLSTASGDYRMNLGRTNTGGSYQYGTSESDTRNIFNVINFTINDNMDLFPVKYTVTFHDNNTNLPESPTPTTSVEGNTQMIQHDMSAKDYAADGLLNAGKKPVVPGYVFKYWTTDTAAQTDPAGEYTPFTVDTVVTGDTDLYAVYGEGYSLTFDPNGGAFDGGSTDVIERELAKGTTIETGQVPSAPARTDNYSFDGWNTAANGTGTKLADANAIVAHDFQDTSATLYAQWTPTSDDIVTVVFNDNFEGASTNTTASLYADPVQINRGDALGSKMATDPKRGGYDFLGWNTVQNGTGTKIESTTEIDPGEGNDTLTVYAQWKIQSSVPDENKVTITFHADDADTGTCPDPIVLHKNDTLGKGNLPANPTKTDRAFNYWAVGSETGTEFDADSPVGADVELYAVWKEKVTITFDAREATGAVVSGSPQMAYELNAGETVASGVFDTLNAAITAPTGYSFNGKWNTDANGSGTDVDTSYNVENSITAYAIYEADADTAMDVVFDANHTTVPNVYETRSIYKEETIQQTVGFPADPTREGYSFSGWYTEAIGGKKVDSTTTETVAELAGEGATSLTLYAHWGMDESKTEDDYYTISFYSNTNKADRDAADQLIDEVKVLKGETLTTGSFAPKRAGFDFADKWNDATGATFDFATAPTADTKLYAIWTTDLTFEFDETPVAYSGSDITATITALTGKDNVDLKDILREGIDYKIVYSKDGTTTEKVVNVGEYDFELIDATEDHTDLGLSQLVNADVLTLTSTTPDVFEVNPAQINFVLTTADSQEQATDGATEVEPDIDIVDGPSGIGFTLSYYTWVDAGEKDGKIAESELTALGDGVKPTAYGEYVVAITLTGDDVANYEIGQLTDIALREIADGSTFAKGANIKFTVRPSSQLTGIKFAQKDSNGADLGEVGVYDAKDLANAVDPVPTTGGNYYAQLAPDATTDIVLEGTLPEGTVEVEVNGVTLVNGQDGVTITSDENGVTISGVAFNPVTSESTNDGFDNTIKITVGGTTVYEIEARQLVKAKIELTPGNSPYGLIERMGLKETDSWDSAKISEAKEAFAAGNLFTTDLLPDGAVADKEYSPNAWVGEDGTAEEIANDQINMDRNASAQIIFNGTQFNDAGFSAYDSTGTKVDDKLVTRTVVVKKMSDADVNAMKDSGVTDESITLSNMESNAESDAFAQLAYVRPGIYDMKYSYKDSYTGDTVESTRKIVVLWLLGDSDLSGILNSTDADTINHVLAGRMDVYSGVDEDVLNLYKFRIVDYDGSAVINSTDADVINHVLAGRMTMTDFYNNL